MEFWITIVGLLRRKGVVISAVLVGLTLGALAYLGTPKTYVSSTTMVLTTTEYGGTESQDPALPTELTNPLLNFNDSLRTTSAILIQSMNTPDVAAQLGARPPTKLVVDDGRSNPELLGLNGPFLYIRAESTSGDDAARIVTEAQKLMRQKLKEWQSSLGAPERTFVSLADVVAPTEPVADRSRATKLGLMALVFGLLLSLGIAYFGHQYRARRRARAAAREVDAQAPSFDGPRGPDPDQPLSLPEPPPVPDEADGDDEDDPAPTPARKKAAAARTPAKKKATTARTPARKKAATARTPAKKKATTARTPAKKKATTAPTPPPDAPTPATVEPARETDAGPPTTGSTTPPTGPEPGAAAPPSLNGHGPRTAYPVNQVDRTWPPAVTARPREQLVVVPVPLKPKGRSRHW